MNKEVWIGKKGFSYWYYKFRDSELYSITTVGVAVLVCIVLLLYWVIPEFNNWFSIRNEVIATQQRIAILQKNITFMNTLDRNTLNQQLQIATQALPANKNFGDIVNAISSASIISGVSLSNYSFEVGSATSALSQSNTPNNTLLKEFSSLTIAVTVNGTIDQVRRFISSLDTSLPLSEVTMVNGNGGNIAITIQFYQKPFSTNNFSPQTLLSPVSAENVALLQKLSTWENASGITNTPEPVGSASGLPLF